MSGVLEVSPAQIAASGVGVDDAGVLLSAGLARLVHSLNGLDTTPPPWGDDDLGRAFFNGGDGAAGFGQMRDGLLDAIAQLAVALRGHGVGAVWMAQNYANADSADNPAFTWHDGGSADTGALHAVLGTAADGLVRDDPAPPFEWLLGLLAELVAGCTWPRGDAGAMGSVADTFDAMAAVIDEVTDDATQHAAAISKNNAGDGIEAFTASFAQLHNNGTGHLVDAAQGCRDTATYCRYMATELSAAKNQFWDSLVYLTDLWLAARVMALLPWGAVAEYFALGETRVIGTVLRRMLTNATARAAFAGVAYSGGLNLVGQRVREDYGLQNGIDWKSFAIASGTGGLAGGTMGTINHLLGRAAIGGNPFAGYLADTLPGRLVANTAIGFGVNVASDAAFNDGHINWGKDLAMAAGMSAGGEIMGAFGNHGSPGEVGDRAGAGPGRDAGGQRSKIADLLSARDVGSDGAAASAPDRFEVTQPIVSHTSDGGRPPDTGSSGAESTGTESTGTVSTSTASGAPARVQLSREGLQEQITALEAHRNDLAGDYKHAMSGVLHHHDPNPEVAAVDNAILRARHDLAAMGSPESGKSRESVGLPDSASAQPAGDVTLAAGGSAKALRVPAGGEVVLGRAGDWPLPYDDRVSRRHAAISVDEAGHTWVRDLGSLNGTYINNGEPLVPNQKVRLRPGDVLALGGHTRLEVGSAPVAPRAAPLSDRGASPVRHVDPAGHEPGMAAPPVHAPVRGGRDAVPAGRRIAEQYGLTSVSDKDAADFFHELTKILGSSGDRELGSGPLSDFAREVIGPNASVVDLLNLHNNAVRHGYEPGTARGRDELVQALRSAHDEPTDDTFLHVGRSLARAADLHGLTDAEAHDLGMVQNYLTRGRVPTADSYRRMVEIAHAAGLGDARAHESGRGAQSDTEAVLRMVQALGRDRGFVVDGSHGLVDHLKTLFGGEPAVAVHAPVPVDRAAGRDSAQVLADHYGLRTADGDTARALFDMTVISDPTYAPWLVPPRDSFPLRDLAHDVLGPDASVTDLLTLERGAREMGYQPSSAPNRAELVDLLKLAGHDLPGYLGDTEREAFGTTQRLFGIPERDDHTVQVVSALKRIEPHPQAARRLLDAAGAGRLEPRTVEHLTYAGTLDVRDASLYDLAHRVRGDLAVRDLVELYKYAEEKNFLGADTHDRAGVIEALRRADHDLGPDLLIARRIAGNLGVGRDEVTVRAVDELNRLVDPGVHERSLPRGVGRLNWLANRIRPDGSVADLIAGYQHARAQGPVGGLDQLVRVLRQADPASGGAPSALRALPVVPASREFLRNDAGPVERWPLSAGSPPSGPIDYAAAADRVPDLGKWLREFRGQEQSPSYWGDHSAPWGEQVRPLEVGWRMDRNALFRGDGRSADKVFDEGFAMPDRGYGSDKDLICTTRSVDTAVQFASMFQRADDDRYVYVIDAPGGYDIGGGQDEVKFIGGVDRRFIVGALRIPKDLPMPSALTHDGRIFYPTRPQDQADWIPNPNYRPR